MCIYILTYTLKLIPTYVMKIINSKKIILNVYRGGKKQTQIEILFSNSNNGCNNSVELYILSIEGKKL